VIFVRFVVKSVIRNPIKPIYGEYKPQSSQRLQKGFGSSRIFCASVVNRDALTQP
jgi:hypothetical protein